MNRNIPIGVNRVCENYVEPIYAIPVFLIPTVPILIVANLHEPASEALFSRIV